MTAPGGVRRRRMRWALLLATGLAAAAARAGEPAAVADWLFQAPPDRARVVLRVTSIDAAGGRQIATLTLRHSRSGPAPRLTLAVDVRGQPPHAFCLRCSEGGWLTPCEVKDGAFPGSADEFVPGTLLPWRALTLGLCRTFSVAGVTPAADETGDVLEMRPSPRPGETEPGFSLRVHVSRETGLPTRIAYVSAQGLAGASVEILEVRRSRWGRTVTRWVYRDAATRARVLVETRSARVEEARPRAGESSPAPSGDDPADPP